MVFLKFTVKCPRDICREYDMQIKVDPSIKDEIYIPEFNACDYYNASDVCKDCRNKILEKFRQDPTLNSYAKPIIP